MTSTSIQLGDVVKVDRKAASESECRSLPFVGLEHIERDTGLFEAGYRRQPESLLATKFRFTSEHVLYSKLRPYLNKVVLPNFDGVSTTEILPLRPDIERLDRAYLYFLLRSPRFVSWASHNVSGANLPRLDPETLREYPFSLPPIRKQQATAASLETCQHLLCTRRYALQLCDEFLAAAFLEMFGDPLRVPTQLIAGFNDILVIQPQNGLYAPPERYTSNNKEGVEVVHMSDLFGGIIKTGKLKRILLDQNEIEKYRLTADDILIARRSINYEGAAQPCRVPHLKQPLAFESSIIRVRPDKTRVLPVYLYYYLNNPGVREKRVRPYVTISTISGINQDGLSRIGVVVPPLKLQENFAHMAKNQENLRSTHVEALRQADHLFQSLLHRAFNGDL